jgi:hypothetical protein
MSKVVIAGDAAVIVSSQKLEDLKKVEKARPDALTLKDDEGNQLFVIATGNKGEVGNYGVVFNAELNDGSGLACITESIAGKPAEMDATDYVVERYGAVISKIDKVEAGIPDTVKAIADEIASLKERVTVIA